MGTTEGRNEEDARTLINYTFDKLKRLKSTIRNKVS